MHQRFRNGIFLLILILLALVLISYYYSVSNNSQTSFIELVEYQKQIDSLKKIAEVEKKAYKQRPFNPNFITDYKGYILGLSPKELDKLYQYRKDDKWINSISDFKKVTGVSDSLMVTIAPLFKFPEWVMKSERSKIVKKKNYSIRSFNQKKDLNMVTAELLQNEFNIPEFIALRIIKYRKRLGGFIDDIQLKDVSGLYENQRNKILNFYTVKTEIKVKKININTATVKELLDVPYFDFETALDIVDFVKDSNGISSLEELGKIEGFSLEKIDRIALYLELN